jgi:DNA-binding Lrp family transcriptional regulator
MRKLNRGACLRLVRERGSTTMAELARASGLSRRTIELIVEELLASGYVREIEPPTDPATRRPTGACLHVQPGDHPRHGDRHR